MSDLVYSFRVNRWSAETTYRQDDETLRWTSQNGQGSVALRHITSVQVSQIRYFGSKAKYWRCVLRNSSGQKICLQAAHYIAPRKVEDRTATYMPFIKKLEARIATANPNALFEQRQHWLRLFDRSYGSMAVVAINLARHIPLSTAQGASAWLMRKLGPLLKGHRVATANLTAAYPEKSPDEIERILTGMWDNLGRMLAEYAHLDRLWDYDPDHHAGVGRIVLDEPNRRRLAELLRTKGPGLVFGAHLANWELLAWALGRYEGETGIVYRPTNIAPVDRKLLAMRAHSGATYIAANADAIFTIKHTVQRGGAIGLLVDEHFPRGVDVMFFGRMCKVTPLFARYARQFDCPIYGARLIRLPDGRFQMEITDALVVPRDSDGKIDVAGTMQVVTGIIETWIREHPEQWMWLQRRWR